MKGRVKRVSSILSALLLALIFAGTTHAEVKVGWLAGINADEGKITIDEALGYPEKKDVTYSIKEDAKWHICTVKACILKKGAEGYTTFKEIADKEAYGKPLRSFRVLLFLSGKKVRALEIQVSARMH